MPILREVPLVRCYEVLHEACGHAEHGGLTARDLGARCNRRYGVRHQGYWEKQLKALAEMGYAEKTGRWINCAPIWVAVAPDEQR
jgi:hypothetical protein